MKFISTDFQGFFDFQSVSDHNVSGVNFTLYRSYCHSFWHDDLNDPAEVEKYQRRIKRFNGISASNDPVLFVRMAASTDEIGQIDQLSSLLKQKFGPRAMLLHIIDLQGSNPAGPCRVAGLDDVLLYYLPTTSGGYEKYGPALNAALAWVAGEATNLKELENLGSACALAVPTRWGHYGMGGIPAFEDSRPLEVSQQHARPAEMVQEVVKNVPVPKVQTVEKIFSVPQIQSFEKITPGQHLPVQETVWQVQRGMPQATAHEVFRQAHVPQAQTVEKIFDMQQLQMKEYIVELPQVQVMDKVDPAAAAAWYAGSAPERTQQKQQAYGMQIHRLMGC